MLRPIEVPRPLSEPLKFVFCHWNTFSPMRSRCYAVHIVPSVRGVALAVHGLVDEPTHLLPLSERRVNCQG